MKKVAISVLFAAALSLMLFVPQASAASCPKNCVSWYDGCNTCGCSKGQITFCTKRACKKKGRAYCKAKAKPSCPTCQTMRCAAGYKCKNIRGCGKCVRAKPKCPTCRTMRCRAGYKCKTGKRGCGKCVRVIKPPTRACAGGCKVWHDGCNDCQCRNGKIAACTKRACVRQGRAYCKKR